MQRFVLQFLWFILGTQRKAKNTDVYLQSNKIVCNLELWKNMHALVMQE